MDEDYLKRSIHQNAFAQIKSVMEDIDSIFWMVGGEANGDWVPHLKSKLTAFNIDTCSPLQAAAMLRVTYPFRDCARKEWDALNARVKDKYHYDPEMMRGLERMTDK